MNVKKALIVGYGSIGKRHEAVLQSLDLKVDIVTRQKLDQRTTHPNLVAVKNINSYDVIVIATPTFEHYTNILALHDLKYDGIVLCEKPLFVNVEKLPELKYTLYLGYNLRFTQSLQTLKQELEGQKIIHMLVNVGQYLPTWRAGVDYRQSYSASKQKGGGVLRDLSHELDYVLWLCQDFTDVVAAGDKYSNLEINSEDAVSIILKGNALISINMNYLYQTPVRQLFVSTNSDMYYIDFVKGTLQKNEQILVENKNDVANSYISMHQALLRGDVSAFCDLEQGMKTMELMKQTEIAIRDKQWKKL